MKALVILMLAVAVISGCVGYAAPYGEPVYVGATVYRGDDGRYRSAERDRDRDGIPNRSDRDRDGDGVPNRQDRRPDNPNRY
jgi:hypothetical protein